MARVKIERGGKLAIAVVVLGALLFLFFEFKPRASKKSPPAVPVEETTARPQPSQAPPKQEESKPVSEGVAQKPREPESQQAMSGRIAPKSPVRIYFAFNKAGINKNVYCIFDRIESIVRRDGAQNLRIVVEGNADSIGPAWYNVELSRRRAARVVDSLSRRLGIQMSSITLVANGSSKPIASNSTPEGRADNRRTDIIIYR